MAGNLRECSSTTCSATSGCAASPWSRSRAASPTATCASAISSCGCPARTPRCSASTGSLSARRPRRLPRPASPRRPSRSRAHALAVRIEAALHGPEHAPVPCHNDLLPANLIHDGARVRIVDWEYAGMGDRYFDLGNLAVNSGLGPADEAALLEAY